MMIQLVYVSSAKKLLSEEELLTLLEQSRANNEKSGVTGMLLYQDGNFMQVLEGEEAVVKEINAKISADPRHYQVITLLQRNIKKREFPEWSMGFRNLSDLNPEDYPGYTEVLRTGLLPEAFRENPDFAHRMLVNFCQTR
ncbi:MAG TPA: BLUF domain-containing protein [Calditrichia bacterium]|nr:BLUF domain-containing protein [Calditrichota bacterium]HQU70674.1 BLUF domain-containing protein [Calditrichia bacterium]HQV32360.1 BLUF domain-containing protein [Calditrichia bacterium]